MTFSARDFTGSVVRVGFSSLAIGAAVFVAAACGTGSRHPTAVDRSAGGTVLAGSARGAGPASRAAVAGQPSEALSATPQPARPADRARQSSRPSRPVAVGKSALPASPPGGYALFTNTDKTVVRWNPCAPIHYSANLQQAADPAAALLDLRAAVQRVAVASGLTLVFDGVTTAVPTRAWLEGGGSASGILIGYASSGTAAGHSDLYGEEADGEGGWWESGTSPNGSDWTWQITRGFVVIDPTRTASYAAGFGAGVTRGALFMHELGHALGMGHASDQSEVMFPVISGSSRAGWGSGDLQGLSLVGRNAGCIT